MSFPCQLWLALIATRTTPIYNYCSSMILLNENLVKSIFSTNHQILYQPIFILIRYLLQTSGVNVVQNILLLYRWMYCPITYVKKHSRYVCQCRKLKPWSNHPLKYIYGVGFYLGEQLMSECLEAWWMFYATINIGSWVVTIHKQMITTI